MAKKITVNFALLGLGKLGVGVYNLWEQKRQNILNETGWDLQLKKILIKNSKFKRASGIDTTLLTTRPDDIIKDDTIKIAIDAIGGIEPTFSIIKKMISNKINLVSANRVLLASKMHELADLANLNKTHILVEPSLGGGVPIISALQRDLVANKIKSMIGILSGTSNYILSEMTEKQCSLKDVLKQKKLQKMGEALSLIDYEGSDAAQKISILAASSFGIDINYMQIFAEGISKITREDICFAKQFGFEFKLLSIIREHGHAFEIRVHPTLVPVSHPLTLVRGEYNAFFIDTDLLGNYMLYGKGVGIEATSSLILKDVIALSDLVYNYKRKSKYILNWQNKPVLSMDDIISSYYVRFSCLNKPGVFGQIAGILGEHDVNISSTNTGAAKDPGPDAGVVHVFIGESRERNVLKALDKIQKLSIILGPTKYFRIFS